MVYNMVIAGTYVSKVVIVNSIKNHPHQCGVRYIRLLFLLFLHFQTDVLSVRTMFRGLSWVVGQL